MQTTWVANKESGGRTDLPDTAFAFPTQRKEPLSDAGHVRNALARFDQVTGVSEGDRALAFANIKKAADYYGVEVSETSWRQLGVHPQAHRKEAAAKAVTTRGRHGGEAEAAVKVTRRGEQRAGRRYVRSRASSSKPRNAG